MSATIIVWLAIGAVIGVGLWLLDLFMRDHWNRKYKRYVAEGHTKPCAVGMTWQKLKCECGKDDNKEPEA